MTNPFINTGDKKLSVTIPKGKNTAILNNVKADAAQIYILEVGADKHRSHMVFPVKPVASAVTPINIMLVPSDPVPDFSRLHLQRTQVEIAAVPLCPEREYFRSRLTRLAEV